MANTRRLWFFGALFLLFLYPSRLSAQIGVEAPDLPEILTRLRNLGIRPEYGLRRAEDLFIFSSALESGASDLPEVFPGPGPSPGLWTGLSGDDAESEPGIGEIWTVGAPAEILGLEDLPVHRNPLVRFVVFWRRNGESRIPAVQGGGIELYGELPPASSDGTSLRGPGFPFLRWGSISGSDDRVTSRVILARIEWNNRGEWLSSTRYFYGEERRLYQRVVDTTAGSRRFSLLDEGERGVIELWSDGGQSIPEYRRFDNRGRLVTRSAVSGSVSVSYRDDGSREEAESFISGSRETRLYDPDNRILSSVLIGADGSRQEREFEYRDDGQIVSERFTSALGLFETLYDYRDDELSALSTRQNGILLSTQNIEGNRRVETRYLRGEAVLRIIYIDGTRQAEEELLNGEVIRRRTYQGDAE